jgi:hypothetical protein
MAVHVCEGVLSIDGDDGQRFTAMKAAHRQPRRPGLEMTRLVAGLR